MAIPPRDRVEMEIALRVIGDREFGEGNYFIDDAQRTISDHLHWHARPNDWVPDMEWIEKIRKERLPHM
jgi:hypothetical protein